MKIIKYIIDTTIKGFLFIINTICSGIYTVLIGFFRLLNSIFKNKFDKPLNRLYGRQKPALILLLIIYMFSFTAVFNMVYSPKQDKVSHDKLLGDNNGEKKISAASSKMSDNKNLETNLYWRFGKTNLKDVNFEELRKQNPGTVAWISVDGTNINYPVVQSSDNDFYLTHSFNKEYNNNGWVFMDFRNTPMEDKNVIFYGHNLLNGTGFGTVGDMFTKSWKKKSSRTIIVLTDTTEYVYKVFSLYYTKPVVGYLTVVFNSDDEYGNWVTDLKNKDTMGLNESVSKDNKIITLSTCTEDNQGRKVAHAKLISVKPRKMK